MGCSWRLVVAVLLVCAMETSLGCGACAQPDIKQSETGISTPNPPDVRKNLKTQNLDRLDGGTPSITESNAIKKAVNGATPRQLIVAYTNKFSKRGGQPFLQSGQLFFVDDPAIQNAFPERLFYTLRFRQWPIGFDIPAPMRSNNIFTLSKASGLKLITDLDQLKNLFKAEIANATTVKKQRDVTMAWIRLQEELAQDGMYQFLTPLIENSTSAKGNTFNAVAKVSTNTGNLGQLQANFVFGTNGTVLSINATNNLQEGMRPICQSTKLLDQDPIIRSMAKRDLLIMGRFAKPYLEEIRSTVSPELKREIDAIWKQIEKENRYP